MKNSCLIIDEMHSSIIPLLEGIGIKPDYRPDIRKDEILSIIGNYDGMIVRSKIRITGEILDKAINLKYIGRAGAGLDNIDEKEVANRNIIVVNAPEGNRDAVGEHTLGMLLTLLNKIHTADRQVRGKIWDREGNRGYELKGKTMAIIGYGYMGKAVAKRVKSFECTTIAYDKYLTNFSDEFVKEVSLEEVFDKTDILSLHIPLTSETKGLINESFIRKFKKDIWLINTARGEILPLKDVVALIQEGKVKGAALDVLENEKPGTLTGEQKQSFDFLVSSDRVLLTPHVGGWTFESYERINQVLVDKIKALGLV